MIIIFSLLLSAFFSGMEIAYVSSNRLNLEIEKNKSGLIPKVLSIITQNPSRFIATMLIGNNFALVIYGIFMGQFIIDNIPFIDLASINEFSALLIQTKEDNEKDSYQEAREQVQKSEDDDVNKAKKVENSKEVNKETIDETEDKTKEEVENANKED